MQEQTFRPGNRGKNAAISYQPSANLSLHRRRMRRETVDGRGYECPLVFLVVTKRAKNLARFTTKRVLSISRLWSTRFKFAPWLHPFLAWRRIMSQDLPLPSHLLRLTGLIACPVRFHFLPVALRTNQSGKDVFYRLTSTLSPISGLSSTVTPGSPLANVRRYTEAVRSYRWPMRHRRRGAKPCRYGPWPR